MYDPTIFDNLKVAIENQVYDLDNLEQEIHITNREDKMDFAVMTRKFAIQFTLVGQPDVTAEIVLKASLEALAGEILEKQDVDLGCSLILRFYKRIESVPIQCKKVELALNAIWEDDIPLTQILSFVYGQAVTTYLDTIEVKFKPKITEDHMREIGAFLDHVLETLEVLNTL